jgi:hypothetical protein
LICGPSDRVSLAQIQDDLETKKWGNAARSVGSFIGVGSQESYCATLLPRAVDRLAGSVSF